MVIRVFDGEGCGRYSSFLMHLSMTRVKGVNFIVSLLWVELFDGIS